jgi:putative endonuclease
LDVSELFAAAGGIMGRSPIVGALSDDDTQGMKHALGRAGEQAAAEYLEGQGVAVLARNWRCPQGELDIIGTDGRTVVFCEVKTRSGVDYGAPLDAVSPGKIRRLRDLARTWLGEQQLEGCRVRFDVISVLWPPGMPPRIEHVEGAF